MLMTIVCQALHAPWRQLRDGAIRCRPANIDWDQALWPVHTSDDGAASDAEGVADV
jgi:hypothetical protein